MYFIAVKFKGGEEGKKELNGPFESHAIAEQGAVGLLARTDVETVVIVDESELNDDESTGA